MTASVGSGALRRIQRPPLWVVFSVTVSGILSNTLINAPLPDIISAFGRGDGAAGLLVAAATLPGIVVAPAIGLLADRFGRRTVLLPCLVVFGLAGLASAFAPINSGVPGTPTRPRPWRLIARLRPV